MRICLFHHILTKEKGTFETKIPFTADNRSKTNNAYLLGFPRFLRHFLRQFAEIREQIPTYQFGLSLHEMLGLVF